MYLSISTSNPNLSISYAVSEYAANIFGTSSEPTFLFAESKTFSDKSTTLP